MADKKPEVMYLEVFDKKDSGFVMDGTENTPAPEMLNAPTTLWIPSDGVRSEMKDGIRHDLKIRWINGVSELNPEIQDKRGFKPNRYEDKIVFEKGFAVVVREGSTMGLFDYLKNVYYNADAPNRPSSVKPLFKTMQVDKVAEGISDHDEMVHEAMGIVLSLRIKTGDNKNPYKYNEERINALCQVLQIGGGDSPATKLHALTSLAKARPDSFVKLVSKFESTVVAELSQAVELGVVKIEGNSFLFAEGGKVLYSIGQGNFSVPAKIEKGADFLKTKEAAALLTELRARIEVAQNNKL